MDKYEPMKGHYLPSIYRFPKLFRRLSNQKQEATKHFISLRESKAYRLKQNAVLIQGLKMLRELRDDGFSMRSITATAEKEPPTESCIKHPAIDVLNHPEAFPAKNYYVCDVDLTRRILGTASRPNRHEIFGEVELKNTPIPAQPERLLVFDHVNDPGNLGTLVRTACALGWPAGLITTGTCDMYNDKTVRASRGMTLRWPHKLVPMNELIEFLKSLNMTPLVADMLDKNTANADVWAPNAPNAEKIGLETGICFWNFKGKPKEVPARPALILSSEHKGVQGMDDELRVSIPMADGVESLNVAAAGSMIMHELNRLRQMKQ
ncbi:Alpha/beta knot methyltransferase [Dichotomocladium elegans]|nr:Alpha/beta knot methyltransferase [Dichotomocladium elegans]